MRELIYQLTNCYPDIFTATYERPSMRVCTLRYSSAYDSFKGEPANLLNELLNKCYNCANRIIKPNKYTIGFFGLEEELILIVIDEGENNS